MIANEFGESLSELSVVHFSDGELSHHLISIEANVLIQSIPPPSDHLMELLLMIDAAKTAAANIIAVIPYLAMLDKIKKENLESQ